MAAGQLEAGITAQLVEVVTNAQGWSLGLLGCSTLIMIQSQVGYVSPYVGDDEDGDDGEVLAPSMSSIPRQ